MLGRVTGTSTIMDNLEPGSTHGYIVQPISYTAICDNVSAEYSVEATCMLESAAGDVNADGEFNISDVVMMQKWLLGVPEVTLVDWKAGDICEDGRLDVFDLCLIKRELLNK